MKSKLLNGILDIVSEVCEVSPEDICSMRKNEYIVEARSIFAATCIEYGLSVGVIAGFLKRKRIISVYDCARNYKTFRKQSYSFRLLCDEVSTKMSEMYPRS